jgi:hypothetical protein
VLNILGMGAAVLAMQATVGALVAKALTTSAVPYYQAAAPGQSPVLALDVFLVQVLDCSLLSPFGMNHSLIDVCTCSQSNSVVRVHCINVCTCNLRVTLISLFFGWVGGVKCFNQP